MVHAVIDLRQHLQQSPGGRLVADQVIIHEEDVSDSQILQKRQFILYLRQRLQPRLMPEAYRHIAKDAAVRAAPAPLDAGVDVLVQLQQVQGARWYQAGGIRRHAACTDLSSFPRRYGARCATLLVGLRGAD